MQLASGPSPCVVKLRINLTKAIVRNYALAVPRQIREFVIVSDDYHASG